MSYLTSEFDSRIVEILKHGGIGFMPSDTVYGLSALAANKLAVKKIHTIKSRSYHRPFIVLISDISQLEELGISINDAEPAFKYWPGPLSIICPAAAPEYLELGTGSLAVRLPDNEELIRLVDRTGPLISTSANLEGQETVHTVEEAREIFGDKLDFYVDAGEIDSKVSTIIKVQGDTLEVIRQGAVKIDKKKGLE
ncbi:MAG: hypothetical protein JWO96_437 [Candidatus Saccharibacteria bacterium]|nr:hypothetical protein [Candidatus Saccharibacteria bacterium]